MKKRILSTVVAMIMLVSCMSFVAFAEDTRYEGIKYFQSAEDMLTDLNEDSAPANSSMWDFSDRVAQQNIVNAAADMFEADFTGAGLVEKWDSYCDRILTRDSDGIGRRDGNVINYLKMIDIYNTDDALLSAELLAVKNEFKTRHEDPMYDVTGLSLKDSFDKLDDYTYQMGVTISHHRNTLDNYVLSDAKKTEYMLKGTKALYQIVFQKTGVDMSNAFNTGFLNDDGGKKLIAVMYGKTLTSELAKDNISKVLIDYVNANFATVKNEFGQLVKATYGVVTEKALFDFLKHTVVKAYESSPTATDEQIADIKMLFGDPSIPNDKGALQIMFESMESSNINSFGMINTWFNLFLRQHTQLVISGTEVTTLEAGVNADANRVVVKNNHSVSLAIKNHERYGILADSSFLNLGSNWLDLKVYNEDHTLNTFVTYSKENARFYVTVDSGKPETYPAYIKLVRNDGTYIETYPIVISNTKSTNRPPSNIGTEKHTISYNTNGGTNFADDKYNDDHTVKLTNVPVKEGYLFEGWYLDAELTIPVTEFVIKEDTVLYAKWVEDNGTAGPSYPTPDILNGDDHFAYVIGYPEGDVRPENNITRAEVASIFFRLLDEDVREEYLSDTNQFSDVNGADWYNVAISTLAKLEILEGRTATEFVPNAPITRAEFATICARFDDSDYAVTDTFTDIGAHWAVSYIREVAARGWIRGYEDDTFRPDRLITRAETMTFINRVLNRAPETEGDLYAGMITWSDNDEGSWYYLAVQEATNSHTYVKKNNVYEKWTGIEVVTDWAQYQ